MRCLAHTSSNLVLAAFFLAGVGTAPLTAQPVIQIKIPAYPEAAFPNFSSLAVPEGDLGAEIWLEGTLGEVQISTIRVTLNEHPMTPFVALNPLPRGVRAIIKFGSSLRPEYRLRKGAENILSFVGTDETRVSYAGRFYLVIEPNATRPALRPSTHPEEPAAEIGLPNQTFPPEPAFTTEWPEKTTDKTLLLNAEVGDRQGLHRVVIEVNGKDTEEVILENELPVRKKNGWRSSGKLPGEVTGDSRRVILSVPVELDEGINVVALRAENVSGLRKRVDRTVERVKPGR